MDVVMVAKVVVALDLDTAEVAAKSLARALHLVATVSLDKLVATGGATTRDGLTHGFVRPMRGILLSFLRLPNLFAGLVLMRELVAGNTVKDLAHGALNGGESFVGDTNVGTFGARPVTKGEGKRNS